MAKNWLDKYEQGGMVLKQKTHDNYGKRENANEGYSTAGPGWIGEGTTNKGFDYNGAWGGTMQNGGFLQPTSSKLPKGYVIPYNTPSTELAMSIGGEKGEPAYLIPSFKGGKKLKDPIAEYKKTGEHLGGPFKTWQEAEKFGEMRHKYVEKGQDIPTPLKTWGDMAMGGSMPGAVGFTYARTQDPAPSNGPYAKKTKASAKNGDKIIKAEFGDYFQNSGQASIGKGVGSAIGSAFFGPLGGKVGGFLGSVAGNVLGGADDANKLANFQTRTKENTERSAWAAGAKSIHGANSSFMKNGGWLEKYK